MHRNLFESSYVDIHLYCFHLFTYRYDGKGDTCACLPIFLKDGLFRSGTVGSKRMWPLHLMDGAKLSPQKFHQFMFPSILFEFLFPYFLTNVRYDLFLKIFPT